MKVDLQKHGSVKVVVPQDAITEAAVEDLQHALEAEAHEAAVRLVVDMTRVPYVDSAGIEFLLALAGDASAGALRARLAGLTETVREALSLTDMLKRFHIFDTVEAAVRSYV